MAYAPERVTATPEGLRMMITALGEAGISGPHKDMSLYFPYGTATASAVDTPPYKYVLVNFENSGNDGARTSSRGLYWQQGKDCWMRQNNKKVQVAKFGEIVRLLATDVDDIITAKLRDKPQGRR